MADLAPALAALLELQARDNAAAALRNRLAHQPEQVAVDAKLVEIAAADAEIEVTAGPLRRIQADQRRLEDEASTLRTKAKAQERTLYSGTVSASKDLQALQDDITSLNARAAELEDQALELMVEVESVDESLEGLRAQRVLLEAQRAELEVVCEAARGKTESELADVLERRGEALASAPADLVARYDVIREAFGGSAVVQLVGRKCEGCPMVMPSMEADRITHGAAGADECGECGRIVVH